MKHTVALAYGFALLLLPATLFAAGPAMKEGLWEITTTMDMPGMPFKMPPTTVSHCYSKEDVASKERVVPKQKDDCKMTDFRQSGNRVTWKVACRGKHASKGEGEMVFRGATAYEGSMKLDSDGMVMTTNYKAKRVGDCK